MTDINKTIKELWQKTYRNQDIDYIQARIRINIVVFGSRRDMSENWNSRQLESRCTLARQLVGLHRSRRTARAPARARTTTG